MGMLLQYHRKAAEAAEVAEPEAKPLSKRNLTELQETAREVGVSEDGTKAELVERIRAKQDEGDNPPPADPEDDTEAEDSTGSEDAEDDTPGE